MLRSPCKTCPWRRGSNAKRIPGLDLDRARALANTCPPNTSDDLSAPLMACHGSNTGRDRVCIGWMLSPASENSLSLRLAMADGRVPLHCELDRADVAVFDTFAEFIANIEATA